MKLTINQIRQEVQLRLDHIRALTTSCTRRSQLVCLVSYIQQQTRILEFLMNSMRLCDQIIYCVELNRLLTKFIKQTFNDLCIAWEATIPDTNYTLNYKLTLCQQ